MGATKQALLEAMDKECRWCGKTTEKKLECETCGDWYACCEECGGSMCPDCAQGFDRAFEE